MPANRMKAAVGSTLKVIGSSSAMVSAGPRPGRTPIAVPSVVPTRHHTRFIGVSATANPFKSCAKASMSNAPQSESAFDQAFDQTGADVDAERLRETEIGNQREGRADAGVAQDRLGAEAARNADKQDDRRDREANRANEQHVEDETACDPCQRSA